MDLNFLSCLTDSQITSEIDRLNRVIGFKTEYARQGQAKLSKIEPRLDLLASEIKAIMPTNKSRGRKIRNLVELFQNEVDLANRIRQGVRNTLVKRLEAKAAIDRLEIEAEYRFRQAEAERVKREAYKAVVPDVIRKTLAGDEVKAKAKRNKKLQQQRSAEDRARRPKPWQGVHIGGKGKRQNAA